jgi:hypothetical protein
LLVVVGIVFLPGCAGPLMAPVKGQVTCNGKPVKEAALIFAPAAKAEGDLEAGKPATGFSDEAGNYFLSTFKNYDGALVGQHTVTITLDDTNPARCARLKKLTLEVKPGNNELNIELNQ